MRITPQRSLAGLTLGLALVLFVTSCGPTPNSNGNNANSSDNSNKSTIANTNKAITPLTCPAKGDEQINAYMSEKTTNQSTANPKLLAIRGKFNSYSKDCVLQIRGHIDQAEPLLLLLQIASESPNSPILDLKYLYASENADPNRPDPGTGTCPDPANYETCGDICVPKGQCTLNKIGKSPTPTP